MVGVRWVSYFKILMEMLNLIDEDMSRSAIDKMCPLEANSWLFCPLSLSIFFINI